MEGQYNFRYKQGFFWIAIGHPRATPLRVTSPDMEGLPFCGTEDVKENAPYQEEDIEKNSGLDMLKDLNICSQRGLIERFDSTVGGGNSTNAPRCKYQLTPAEGMVAKLPVLDGDTTGRYHHGLWF